nr:GNAT family N-acetyltransferase [Caldimonas sp.]
MTALALADRLALEVCRPQTIEDAWQRLWLSAPAATPFSSPAWLVPWARHYAPGRCVVATVAAHGELVACLPMFWWKGRLFLAGTGPSDHGDGVFARGFEDSAAALLRAAVAAIDRPVERIELCQLLRSSPLLAAAPPLGWRDCVVAGDACPVLAIAGDDGMGNVGKRMRRNWRYAMHAIARAGGVIERVDAADAAPAAADLERLHALRWHERGEAGVLADPLQRRLLADAVPALAAAAMLRMLRVRVADRTVAVLFALHGERQTCCYLSGFDPAFAHLSPVTALVGATIAAAAREGDETVDFLRGSERYKAGWGASPEPRFRRVLVPG